MIFTFFIILYQKIVPIKSSLSISISNSRK